nr:protoporphyrinogen oxidase [Quercus suber]
MLRRGHAVVQAPNLWSLLRRSQILTSNGARPYSSDGQTQQEQHSLIQRRRQHAAILGGGITGLATAYYITKFMPGTKVTIYEASDRIGGWLLSKRVPVNDGSIIFEAGPRTLRPTPNGLLAARMLQELDLAKHAIVPQKTSPAARNRYIYYPDHLVRMPHPSFGFAENLWTVLSESVFKGFPWAVLREYFREPRDPSLQDESIGSFITRRFDKRVADQIVSAVLHGIYAGDIRELSVKSLLPGLWRMEADAGGVMAGMLKSATEGPEVWMPDAEFRTEVEDYAFEPVLQETLKSASVFTLKEGLGQLVDGLARNLLENGNVEFRTSTPVQSIRPTDERDGVWVKAGTDGKEELFAHVISALNPGHLNKTSHTSLVPHIPTVTVMTVNLYYRTPGMHPPGFGYVIPRATPFENNPERALGVVFDTAYSPDPTDLNRANWHDLDMDMLRESQKQGRMVNVNDFGWINLPEQPNMQDQVKERGTKLTVMLGGHWWKDWPAYPNEEEGLALAKSVVERHLSIKEEPEVWQVNMQKDCIPQYTVGHEQRLKAAHNNIWREYKGRLRVAGSWMSGVGVNDCLRSAWDVVKGLTMGRDGTGLDHVGRTDWLRVRPSRGAPKEEQ